ncbi:slipin family protein [Ketobacter sp.]|uniref:slipin family protein n=1 Tax=Ketobacter sp. TaxID=2083498 RepID=UPI000F1301BB|nr:slipin family protein [Ketobacter sp.]RLT96871.1 MAG: slipin family protein [Ketobacter sp.]
MFWKTVYIADNERGLLYRHDRLQGVLQPGRHRVSLLGGPIRLDKYDVSSVVFEHVRARFLLNQHGPLLNEHLNSADMGDEQLGLVYRNNHLVDVIAPGAFYAYWKGIEDVRIDVLDLKAGAAVSDSLLGVLGRGANVELRQKAQSLMLYVEVPEAQVGLMFLNGKFERELNPGHYGFWQLNRHIQVVNVDLRVQSAEVSGQEILTKDRVSLRINLSANYQVVNARQAALKVKDFTGFVYRELQFGLREVVGEKSLDDLLADKDALNNTIFNSALEKLSAYGIRLLSVGIKDIILPGDMKAILNQVVQAQKEAEANLIKRREETQAMRSLHNTARMMDNNPVLLRLKELESLERVVSRIGQINVYGGLEAVMTDLVRLKDVKQEGKVSG